MTFPVGFDDADAQILGLIVASKSGTLYVGVTDNLDRRVFEHKQKLIEGFTRKYGCDRLVWHEQWTFAQHAIHREKQLKGWTRARKIALIEEMNPRWADLAEGWGQALGGSKQKA